MRRLGVATALSLSLCGLSGPSLAKGLEPVEARITGPGLQAALVLRDPEGLGGARMTSLDLFSGQALHYSYGGRGRTLKSPVPPGERGPRYTIRWRLVPMLGGDRTVTLRQELFPYAEPGPVLFLPESRWARRNQLATGWMRATPALRTNLQAWGLPGRSAEEDRTRLESEERSGVGAPLVALLVGTVALLSGGALALRRRSSAPAANPAP